MTRSDYRTVSRKRDGRRAAGEEAPRMLNRAIVFLAIGVALQGCAAVKTVGGSVDELNLPRGASITSSSLGQDGRMWFGYLSSD